jgi:hypothetical protein
LRINFARRNIQERVSPLPEARLPNSLGFTSGGATLLVEYKGRV